MKKRGLLNSAILILLLTLSTTTSAQPVILKTESHLDDKTCFHFAATARVEQPLGELYEALSRPEALYFFVPAVSLPTVFVGFRPSKDFLYNSNAWSIGDPYEKILEFDLTGGKSVGPSGKIPRSWSEYRFIRSANMISRRKARFFPAVRRYIFFEDL